MQLSSFGTVQAYPVIAQLANLESFIRNGTGIDGGTVVGWLLIVSFCGITILDDVSHQTLRL